VVPGANRPEMDKNYPKALAMLITNCWARDPATRPSFDLMRAKPIWQEVADVYNSSGDIQSKKLLAQFEEGQKTILFSSFVQTLKKTYERESYFNMEKPDSNVRALMALLNVNKISAEITKEVVERFVCWFREVAKVDLEQTLYSICCKPWFWCVLDATHARTVLSKKCNAKVGTYLVRWEAPFWWISFIAKSQDKLKSKDKGELVHHHSFGGETRISKLAALVDKFCKENKLVKPADERPLDLATVQMTTEFISSNSAGMYVANVDTGVEKEKENIVDFSTVGTVSNHYNFVL